jgi:hypothetical protein
MRNKRFVAVHCGGPLNIRDHQALIDWAIKCVEHSINKVGYENQDDRPLNALVTAKKWMGNNCSVGDARKAAFESHDAARKFENKIDIAIARSCGHAVATAHMADHSLQAAIYALKAIELAGFNTDVEKDWQNSILPENIKELVLSSRE